MQKEHGLHELCSAHHFIFQRGKYRNVIHFHYNFEPVNQPINQSESMMYVTVSPFLFLLGSRQTRGENWKQVCVPGVQPRIHAAQRNKPRKHQIISQQGWCTHSRSTSASNRGREAYPYYPPISDKSAFHNAPLLHHWSHHHHWKKQRPHF